VRLDKKIPFNRLLTRKKFSNSIMRRRLSKMKTTAHKHQFMRKLTQFKMKAKKNNQINKIRKWSNKNRVKMRVPPITT
jgi:hypothetical protein